MWLLAHVPRGVAADAATAAAAPPPPFSLDQAGEPGWADEATPGGPAPAPGGRLLRDREEGAAYACAVLEGAGNVNPRQTP
eukprot:5376974-Pyramimonas_sp.AAC.1